MLMVDLAVPRDIDPKVESLDAQRRQAAVEAEVMVNQLVTQLVTQQKVKEAGGTIQQFREHGEEQRQMELSHALERIQAECFAKPVKDSDVLLNQAIKDLHSLSTQGGIMGPYGSSMEEANSHMNFLYYKILDKLNEAFIELFTPKSNLKPIYLPFQAPQPKPEYWCVV
ncbi:unnamed protein product [Oppiella nova]|uniref:Tetrapyrrole biosynthesis glutamyl-tRNA reductase dimerisation domain-containing protein n=1 Tax=Oppiella nova TaxID=334625 RepID=A0A7R9L7R2_9ACAR|nr:unnamed protein product [Oppiella nova]CAG2157703.1 unnamed protein product [Oppiella nova]